MTSIQQLDSVLNYLTTTTTWSDARNKFPEIQLEEMRIILRKLRKDGYIDLLVGVTKIPWDHEPGYDDKMIIQKNFEGSLFSQEGGYSKKNGNERKQEQGIRSQESQHENHLRFDKMFYNLFIEHNPQKKYYKIALSQNEINTIVNAFLKGEETIRIKGHLVDIKNPSKFFIYNIQDNLGSSQQDVEFNVRKSTNLIPNGSISQRLFSTIGANVTNQFLKNMDWGSLKNISDKKFDKNLIKKKTGKIFISHSSKDENIVTAFCHSILDIGLGMDLEKEVFNTSLEGSMPKSGDDFRIKIKEELLSAKAVLQFISTSYKESEVCLNEMGAAWVLSENVIPLIIDPDVYEVGFIHNTTQQIQLSDKKQILRFVEDHKGKFLPSDFSLTKLNQSIEEFEKKYNEFITKEDTKKVITKTLNTNQEKSGIKQNALFVIEGRAGYYIYTNNELRHIPDALTEKLLGVGKKETKNISIEEASTIGKSDKAYPSVFNCEIIKTPVSDRYFAIMENKKRFLPNFSKVHQFIRNRNFKISMKIVDQSFLDDFEEDESLFELQ